MSKMNRFPIRPNHQSYFKRKQKKIKISLKEFTRIDMNDWIGEWIDSCMGRQGEKGMRGMEKKGQELGLPMYPLFLKKPGP